ncbi:MAG: permease-like cell division protein FtsX [Kurthia sp.]|nr:permease-like cell division protein FtsX [Candidatus Kurthia equi]
MNNDMTRYVASDACTGLMRNKGGSIASVLFVALSISFIGIFLLLRVLVSDVTDYLDTQLSMKVYVEQSISTEEVAHVLQDKRFVADVAIEKGDDLLDRLSFFFAKRDYLLDAFSGGKVNDAIRLTLTNADDMEQIAKSLEEVNGIEKVVYPQELATLLQKFLSKMTMYGVIISVILIIVTFFMIYTTFHLALYRREKELKVKLLVGMNPAILRLQFLLEGLLIGICGAIIAAFIVYGAYQFAFASLDEFLPFISAITTSDLWNCIGLAVLGGLVMCVCASYLATRKWIRHA